MPFVKIHILEGRYDEARLDSVSNAIQQALRAELGMASDELFHIIHLLQPAQFRHTLGLLKALNDGVVDAAQISPDDLLITFFETAGENISFGRGFAQRADNSKLYSGS